MQTVWDYPSSKCRGGCGLSLLPGIAQNFVKWVVSIFDVVGYVVFPSDDSKEFRSQMYKVGSTYGNILHDLFAHGTREVEPYAS